MRNLLFGMFVLCFMSCNALAGNTHHVRGYTKNDGSYVPPHESGNPGSNVHCHNNECY